MEEQKKKKKTHKKNNNTKGKRLTSMEKAGECQTNEMIKVSIISKKASIGYLLTKDREPASNHR